MPLYPLLFYFSISHYNRYDYIFLYQNIIKFLCIITLLFMKKNKNFLIFLKKLLTYHPMGGIIKTRNEGKLKIINKKDKF